MSDEIEKQDDVLSAMVEEFEAIEEKLETSGGDGNICNYVLQILNEADADEKKVKEMSATMLRDIANRRKALMYVFGQQFRNQVTMAIKAQPGKKKSVNYLMGKAGFRTAPEHIEFTDVEKAKLWAIENLCVVSELTAAISGIAKTEALILYFVVNKIPREFFADLITGLNKTPFMNHIKATGEVPPGVELIDKFDKFTINGKAVDETPILPTPADVRGILADPGNFEESKDAKNTG